MAVKHLKKTLRRDASPWERGALPSKGGKCKHQGECWKVRLFEKMEGDLDTWDTYHFSDESGAVMFALRVSRDRSLRAIVHDPLGNVICSFGPREYDVNKYRRSVYRREVWDDVQSAKSKATKTKKPLRKGLNR